MHPRRNNLLPAPIRQCTKQRLPTRTACGLPRAWQHEIQRPCKRSLPRANRTFPDDSKWSYWPDSSDPSAHTRLQFERSDSLKKTVCRLIEVQPSQFQVYGWHFTVYLRKFGRVWCVLGGKEQRPTLPDQDQRRVLKVTWNTSAQLARFGGSWVSQITDIYRRSHPKFHSTTTGSESV